MESLKLVDRTDTPMAIDLRTVDRNIAQAKADLAFWENLRAALIDPRVLELVRDDSASQRPSYGDLKRAVYAVLPAFGEEGVPTAKLVELMQEDGFIFQSKTPGVSVNEALNTLNDEGKAFITGRRGVTKFWTRGESKTPA
jgi:hypothetical protein